MNHILFAFVHELYNGLTLSYESTRGWDRSSVSMQTTVLLMLHLHIQLSIPAASQRVLAILSAQAMKRMKTLMILSRMVVVQADASMH